MKVSLVYLVSFLQLKFSICAPKRTKQNQKNDESLLRAAMLYYHLLLFLPLLLIALHRLPSILHLKRLRGGKGQGNKWVIHLWCGVGKKELGIGKHWVIRGVINSEGVAMIERMRERANNQPHPSQRCGFMVKKLFSMFILVEPFSLVHTRWYVKSFHRIFFKPFCVSVKKNNRARQESINHCLPKSRIDV